MVSPNKQASKRTHTPHRVLMKESGRGGHTGDNAHSFVYWKRPLHKELTSTRDHEPSNYQEILGEYDCV